MYIVDFYHFLKKIIVLYINSYYHELFLYPVSDPVTVLDLMTNLEKEHSLSIARDRPVRIHLRLMLLLYVDIDVIAKENLKGMSRLILLLKSKKRDFFILKLISFLYKEIGCFNDLR